MNWRRILSFGLIILFALVFIAQWRELGDIFGVLQRGRPLWLLVALALQGLWFINQAALYQSIYRLLDLPASVRRLLPIVLAANFVNFATPTASLGALPLFLGDARQRGLDPAKITLVNLVRLLLNLVWFSIPLSFSLTVLFTEGLLRSYHLVAATLLLTATILMALGILLAGVRPARFGGVLARVLGILNWVGQRTVHRDLLGQDKTDRFAHDFGAAAMALWTGRRRLVRPWIHSMLLDVLEIGVMFAVFNAFPDGGRSLDLIHLVTGYSVGVLFSVVAITPQGLGVVEGTLVAAFAMLGIPTDRAAVVMLAYRVMSFWLPLLVGFVALRWVRGVGRPVRPTDSDDQPGEASVALADTKG